MQSPRRTPEATEREERRAIMAVLKQNLAMGIITKDEYVPRFLDVYNSLDPTSMCAEQNRTEFFTTLFVTS